MRILFVLTVVTGLIENLLFTGILFGWPSLEFVLIHEGYFRYKCPSNYTADTPCESQSAALNLVYYMGIIAMSFSGLPFGYFMDHYGTLKTRIFGCASMTIGTTLLVASTANIPWLLYPGMFIFVTGSVAAFITNPQTGNFFPGIRAMIITMFDGMLASSACVCLVIKIAYENGYKLQNMLIFFMCLTILPWLRTITLMPRQFVPYPFKDPDFVYGIYEWFNNNNNDETTLLPLNEKLKSDIVEKKRPSNFKNILFWTNTYQFAIYALRNVFFDGSLNDWLHTIYTNETHISNLINLYGILLFFAFAVSAASGLLVDSFTNFHKGAKALYFGLLASSIVTSIIMIILSTGVVTEQPILTYAISLIGQGFVYGSNTTFIAYVFPMEDFGKVYGLSIFIGGLVMLLEFGMFKLSLLYDPSFLTVNYLLLGLSISTLIHPIVWAKRGLNYELQT